MRICVFGAASPTIDKTYIEKVEALGEELVRRGHSLVFGGGNNGLMGAVARGVKREGGYIFGVIPKFFGTEVIEEVCDFCDKLVKPDTMRERKQIMEDNADAFIIVPGGIGTYEEYFEILTSRQLCRHNKPIAMYNIDGYYDDILRAMENSIKKGFINEVCTELTFVSEDAKSIFEYIESAQGTKHTVKELKNG